MHKQMASIAPRHTIFFQTQMAPVGLRSLIPPAGGPAVSLGARGRAGRLVAAVVGCGRRTAPFMELPTQAVGSAAHLPAALHPLL